MIKEKNFILKGNIAYSDDNRILQTFENSYLVCENGLSAGVFSEIPEKYKDYTVLDYTDKLIIPGMTDLHVHAPQYTFRGLGMDKELLEWLQTYTFPEEEKYQDITYAEKAYKIFSDDLKNSFTTRAAIYSTVHKEATLELMNQLEKSGLITYVGKVNMDRNGTEGLCSTPLDKEIHNMREWISESASKFKRTFPIITPRFIPSCSDQLMEKLGELQKEYHLRAQSHLSENLDEIAWVKELVPSAETYGKAYDMFGMLGNEAEPAIMAHCVYSEEAEVELLKKRNTFIAHCPDSNLNIASGIAPVRKYLELGMNIGLGTDVAGGASLAMPRAVTLAIQSSKMYWRLVDQNVNYITFQDAFYMATLGGGKYFGKAGSFEKDYEFDALVIDDLNVKSMQQWSVADRVERMMYHYEICSLVDKYVAGEKIDLKKKLID